MISPFLGDEKPVRRYLHWPFVCRSGRFSGHRWATRQSFSVITEPGDVVFGHVSYGQFSLRCSLTGAGVEMCLQRALESSGVAPEDVNYVNAHATSTLAGDLQEYKALHRAFGSNADVSTTLSLFPARVAECLSFGGVL